MQRLPRIGVMLMALLLASCVTKIGQFAPRYSSSTAKIAAILERATRELESQMADGPDYRLTELRGMDAANKLGSEGKDASILWEQEINRHYRERKAITLRDISQEIASYDAAYLASILAVYVPGAVNSNWNESDPAKPLLKWGIRYTQAYGRAHDAADCRSLETTPLAWHRLYPDRAPFTFERFGIDEPLIRRWCSKAE
jgi:hypothetical protein